MQARLCELGERENAGRKRAQVYPLRYSEHVFARRRRDLVAQRAAAQGIFEMASREKPLFIDARELVSNERRSGYRFTDALAIARLILPVGVRSSLGAS